MLDFTTKEIESSLEALKREVNEEMANTPDYVAMRIDNEIKEMKRHDQDTKYIYKYDMFVGVYANCAKRLLLVSNDKQKFKGCCYLAARAGEMCYALYDRGFRDFSCFGSLGRELGTRETALYYTKYAVLANCRALAVRIAPEESLLGAVLAKDYERAKMYLPEKVKEIKDSSFFDQIFWAIIYENEKKVNQYLEARIKWQRRYKKLLGVNYFDDFGLALIKLAQERGMKCTLNVAELPWHLLDDDPINEEEWQLPEDSGLEQLLRNEKK